MMKTSGMDRGKAEFQRAEGGNIPDARSGGAAVEMRAAERSAGHGGARNEAGRACVAERGEILARRRQEV